MGYVILIFVIALACIFAGGYGICSLFSVPFMRGGCRYADMSQTEKDHFRNSILLIAAAIVPALLYMLSLLT
ncbi:hypothetical protein [Oscillibacter sp.]|uniref:hypothetical protein n=1 Tax=Oscillibacter sp. TaxID=1945593 RepID=UPI003397BCE4